MDRGHVAGQCRAVSGAAVNEVTPTHEITRVLSAGKRLLRRGGRGRDFASCARDFAGRATAKPTDDSSGARSPLLPLRGHQFNAGTAPQWDEPDLDLLRRVGRSARMERELQPLRRIPFEDLSPLEPPPVAMFLEDAAADRRFEHDAFHPLGPHRMRPPGPPVRELQREPAKGSLLIPTDDDRSLNGPKSHRDLL